MAAQLTDLLVSTAEVSNLLSFLAVLGGLLVMMAFIIRMLYQELGDGGGVTRVTHRAPQTRMCRVSVPITLAVEDAGERGVTLKVSSQVPYILRYCWGVEIPTFHHVLRSPWPWFHEAALRGNLFGSGCIEHGQASPVLQPHEELGLVASSPQELSLGPSPRNSYPLVVVAIRADLGEDVEDLTMVTSLLAVVHIKDSVCPIPTQVLTSYVRQGAVSTQLVPLFVTSSPGESSDTESAEEEETEDMEGPLSSRARCVVCQLERVTRAALPCRHAITCGSCFDRLKSQCPMCRAFINSYFLLGPEPQPAPDTPPPPSPASLWERAQRRWEDLNLWVVGGLGGLGGPEM